MADATWKAFERRVARVIFDTERNALSGRNNRNDDGSRRLGDNLRQDIIVECKKYKKIGAVSAGVVTKTAARKINEIKNAFGSASQRLSLIMGSRSVQRSSTVTRAETVKSLADGEKVPWIHLEQQTNKNNDLLVAVMPFYEMVKMIRLYLYFYIDKKEPLPTDFKERGAELEE